jgi:serine/threonine protein kinase
VVGAHSGISTLPIGTRLERYVIEEVLGVGGFGVTYLAEHELLKKRFAIKEPRGAKEGLNAVPPIWFCLLGVWVVWQQAQAAQA